MLCHDGKVSLIAYIGHTLLVLSSSIAVLFIYNLSLDSIQNASICIGISLVIYTLLCAICYVLTNQNDYEIIKRAALLGICLGLGIFLFALGPPVWKQFGVYASLMSVFHFSEYLAIAWSNPRTLSTDTFMLNHSAAYAIAAITSWIEFLIEAYFCPIIKGSASLLVLGLLICICGEILRKVAIITANSNFNHLVQYRKAKDHNLVTHGVYRYMRHPSYAGWFWWSIGTQIVLCNPVCIILYAIASWKFFHERILVEEITLVSFFQQEYVDYQKKTGTGVPFIKGFVDYEQQFELR